MAVLFLVVAVSLLAPSTRTPSSVTTETIAALAAFGVFIGGLLFFSGHGKSGRIFFELGGSSGFAGLVATTVKMSVFGGSPADGVYLVGMGFAFVAYLIAKRL